MLELAVQARRREEEHEIEKSHEIDDKDFSSSSIAGYANSRS